MKSSLDNILLLTCRLFDSDACCLVNLSDGGIEYLASNLKKSIPEELIIKLIDINSRNPASIIVEEAEDSKFIIKKISGDTAKNIYLILSTSNDYLDEAGIENIELIDGLIKDFYAINLLEKVDIPQLISGLNSPILITNPEGQAIFANELFYSEFNIDDSKEFSTRDIKFFDENNSELEFENYPFNVAAQNARNVPEVKLKLKSVKEAEKWYNINSIIIKDKNTLEVKLVVTSFWDISQLKEIEYNLNETVHNVESVLYSVPSDGNGYNYISNAVQRLFGYSPSDVYKHKYALIRIIVPEHLGIFRDFRDQLLQGRQAVAEYKILDKFGNQRYLRNAAVPIMENDQVSRIVGVISDITEQRNILDRLSKSEEKYRLLIDTAEDIIFNLDAEGNFLMVNKHGANALGYSPKEMIGKYFLDFVSDKSKPSVGQAFIDIISSERLFSFESEFIDKVGDSVIFEIQARSTKFDDSTSGVLGIGRDISEHRKNQHKLEDLNKKLLEANQQISIERDKAKHQIDVLEELNRLKNEFISNVSHELRTPLASIIGFAETISTDKELPLEMVLEFNNIILNEGKRLAKLINDVLDFSKLESGREGLNKTHFVFKTFLQEILSAFNEKSSEKNINFRASLPNDEIIVYADRERLSKAISHVLSNALKFTSANGEITVDTLDQKEEVELRISDTGIGIPKEEIPNLFQKFSKINRAGSSMTGAGFGLVTVKQIIDAHRGSIEVDSAVNKGTTFKIKLPKKN